jgi:hypothetical protein
LAYRFREAGVADEVPETVSAEHPREALNVTGSDLVVVPGSYAWWDASFQGRE